MDWFDKDDNMFIDKDNTSNYYENDMDIESIFLKKQNSFVDYESKIDDFIFNKLNDKPEKTNILEVDAERQEKMKDASKIFAINKCRKESTAISINSLKYKIQNKEELLTTHVNTQANLQNSNTKSIKETAIGSLSPSSKEEIQEFKLFPKDYTTTSVDDNSWTYKNDISLNSKESIKSLTEEEEKYDNMSLYNNTDNKSVIMTGMKQLVYNLNANSAQSSSNSLININYSKSLGQLTHSERMKLKKERAKFLLEKKRDRSQLDQSVMKENEEVMEENTNSLCYSKVTTNTVKEVKMLRNRISAQRSRDRKKKEIDDLKTISQNLLNENYMLKKELENRDKEIREMKSKLRNLCRDCNELFTGDVGQYSLFNSSNRFASSLKFSMMAGFLVIVCIIGTLTLNGNGGIDQNQSQAESFNKLRNLNEEAHAEPSIKSNIDSSGIILYNHLEKKESATKLPFEIRKDIDKFITRKLKNSEFNELNFLGKKRLDFFSKMEMRKKSSQSAPGFLKQNDNEQCINVDGVSFNVNDEDKEDEQFANGVIVKDENQVKNGIVPVKNSRFTYEKSTFRDNIKSMYCKDFITTAEENSQMFKNLFEKLNKKIENKLSEESKK